MRSPRTFLSVGLLGAALFASDAAAQDLRVTGEGVRLRAGANKFTRILRILDNGEPLALVRPDSLQADFFHVRAGELTGWVHRDLVERVAAPDVLGTAVLPVIRNERNPATAISSAWDKPPLVRTTFRNGAAECGPFGTPGSDSITNEQKNRADVPASYYAVTFDAIADTTRLRWPHGAPTSRSRWRPDQLAAVAPFEGIPVSVVGYIRIIRPQASNREGTNCGLTGEANTDWHVALVRGFQDPESAAIVVEPTPRMKQRFGGRWTRPRLRRWENPQSPADSVRISGYLLFDPSHANHLGRFRTTMWEIHPITRIEVFRDGACRILEDEP